MLSRLFKSRSRFDDPNPEIRRASVLAIADEEAKNFQDDFAEIARSDADLGVRRAALSKILEGRRLEPFLTDAHPDIVRAAAEAIARDTDSAALLNHPQVRSAAIRNARDPESVARLIGDVVYDSELIRLAIDSRNPKVRLAVADKLMKESSLTELEHLSRDKDKNVNRLMRSRLDDIKGARAELDKALRRAEELVYTVETQLKSDSDPLFAARLGVVKHDWLGNHTRHAAASQRLAAHGVTVEPLTELSRRFDSGVAGADAVAATLAARSVATPTAAVAKASEMSGPSSTDAAAFIESLTGLENLFESLRRGERDAFADIDTIGEEGRRHRDHWLATADHQPPPEQLVARFHTVTHSLSLLFEAAARIEHHADELNAADAAAAAEPTAASVEDYAALWNEQRRTRQTAERLGRTLERIDWPAELPRPARLIAADAQRVRLSHFDTACHVLHEQLVQRLSDIIAKLTAQIDAGSLAAAAGLEGEGKRLLHSLPEGTAKRVHGDFVALSARVQELKDWRTFATHPKREQFALDMEKIATEPLPPALQAERIRELREAWQGLGPVTHHNDRRLLDRFNHAAEAAFKPCREYFDAQAATRKFNLDQRHKIFTELTGYVDGVDWDHADWRAAEKILYTARDEWRKYHPVDRSPGRKLDTQFDALTARLHEKLKTQWDHNAAAKQAIVDEAKAIQAGGGEPRDGINKVKALQQRWRAVGIVPRRIDQRLWKEFRAACDAVFDQREVAITEQRQAVESQLAQADQLCEEFQQAFEGASSDTAQADVVNDFNGRFSALGELPRDSARRIEQRFREIERNYRLLLRQAQHDAVIRGVDRLYNIDNAVSELEQSLASGNTSSAAVMERIGAIKDLDPARRGPFAERLQALERGDVAALSGAATPIPAARRRLAIEMEIAAGLDTPPEHQRDRLALQVDRLNQGMKHRRVMDEAPMQLAERWCRTGPVLHDEAEARERFFRACRIALE